MRLPGRCEKCGARVELRLVGEVEVSERAGPKVATKMLPTAWCEPGTEEVHRCPDKR